MTVYFIGASYDGMKNFSEANNNNSSATFDPYPFMRPNFAQSTGAPSKIGDIPLPAAGLNDFWFHYGIEDTGVSTQFTGVHMLFTNNGNNVLQLDGKDNNVCALEYWDGSAWNEVLRVTLQDFRRYDIHIVLDEYNGVVECFCEGNLFWTWDGTDGDTMLGTEQVIDNIEVHDGNTLPFLGMFVVADEPTINWWVGDLYPDGDGNQTDFTGGGGATNVSDFFNSSTDFITGIGINDIEQFTCTDINAAISGNFTIRGVSIAFQAEDPESNSAPQSARAVLRLGSVNYFGDTELLGEKDQYFHIWQTDPGDTNEFLEADLNAMEIGIQALA